MLLRASLLCLMFCGLPPAWADTVWLNNGDRLSGEVLLLDGGKLALKTKYAGQVLINWKDVETLRSDKPLFVRRKDGAAEHISSLNEADKGSVLLAGPQKVVPLASIDRLVAPRPLLKDRVWEGNLDAKLDINNDENRTKEWKLKGDSRLEHGRWRHVLNGELELKEKNQDRTADNWQLEYSLDRFMTDHWFWRVNAEYDEDRFNFLRRQRSIGSGPGYRFWDDELGRFDLIAQLNRLHLTTQDRRYALNTLALGWDYKRLLWGTRVELYSSGEVQLPQVDGIDYVLDSEVGIRYRLNDWARLSLLYELDQAVGLGQTSRSQRYLLGVGVGW